MEDLLSMAQKEQKFRSQVSKHVQMLQTFDPEEWNVFHQLIQPPALIAVMGVSGAGKSTLIRALGGKGVSLEDETAEAPFVGHNTESETQELGTYVTWHNARKIVFVEIPGFDDPKKGDDKTLKQIAEYLVALEKARQYLTAVIYVLPINHERYSKRYHHNQELFQKICGKDPMHSVFLVTTKWDRASDDDTDLGGNFKAFEAREQKLKTSDWKEQVDAGVRLYRHSRKLEQSSKNLLDEIVGTKGGISLLLEDQIVRQERKLGETDPAKYLKDKYANNLYGKFIQTKEQEIQDIDAQIGTLKHQQMTTSDALARKARLQEQWQQLRVQKTEADQKYGHRLNEWTFSGMAVKGSVALGIGAEIDSRVWAGWGIAAEKRIAIGYASGLAGGVICALAAGGIGLDIVASIWAGQKHAQSRRRQKAREALLLHASALPAPPSDDFTTLASVLEQVNTSFKPSLRDSTSRLLQPRKYFSNLRTVNHEIFSHSAMNLAFKAGNSTHGKYVIVPVLPSSSESSVAVSRYIESKIATKDHHALLQCRNVLQRVIYNLHRLKSVERIFDRFTIIVADRRRPKMARMHSIKLETVEILTDNFVETCRIVVEKGTQDIRNAIRRLQYYCSNELILLELLDKAEMTELPPAFVWRLLVHTIDAAVIIYAGSHTAKLTDHFMPEAQKTYVIPGAFTLFDAHHPSFHLLPRRLECLNEFLDNSEVWVFHCVRPGSPPQTEGSLYLACRVEELADTWGPLSKTDVKTKDGLQLAYFQLGAGAIVPWNRPKDLTLRDEEIYCHWMEGGELNTTDLADSSSTFFTDSPIMVIGAQSKLLENSHCTSENCMSRLRQSGRLLPLSSTRSHEVIESRTQELVTGVTRIGVLQGKFGRTLKPSVDVCSWKDAIINEWSSWDPTRQGAVPPFATLDTMIGLQISACTNSARRVTLRNLLLSKGMRSCFRVGSQRPGDMLNHLDEARSGSDAGQPNEPSCPFSTLWSHFETSPTQRTELYNSICRALQRLRKTGFVKEGTMPHTFYAYYGLELGLSYRVDFPPSDWMHLLKDSVSTGCAAVMVLECLISEQPTGRTCQANHYPNIRPEPKPTLETLILVDHDQKPEGVRWSKGEARFKCNNQAVNQRWALESPNSTLRDIGIRCTGVLDTFNEDGLATEWRSTLRLQRIRSSVIPLTEVESMGHYQQTPLRVFIT